jgi:hypothetical protein
MHRVVHDIRQRGPAHLAIAVVLALGVSACGKRDRVSGAPETKSTASTAAAQVFAARARATTRPQRYRYRIVGHVAVYGFRRDGSGNGWGAYFRVSPRLPLRTEVDLNRVKLVLRDVNSNKVLSDSDPLIPIRTLAPAPPAISPISTRPTQNRSVAPTTSIGCVSRLSASAESRWAHPVASSLRRRCDPCSLAASEAKANGRCGKPAA